MRPTKIDMTKPFGMALILMLAWRASAEPCAVVAGAVKTACDYGREHAKVQDKKPFDAKFCWRAGKRAFEMCEDSGGDSAYLGPEFQGCLGPSKLAEVSIARECTDLYPKAKNKERFAGDCQAVAMAWVVA